VLVHALMKLGAVLLPLSPRLSAEERVGVIAAEEPAVDLDDAGELTQTEADLPLLGEHDMDDIAARVMTSGSTGTPDPIDLTYGNFLWSAVGSAFNIGVEPSDRWLCCLPLSHISGLGIVMRSVIYGTAAVLHDGFDVDRVARAPREVGASMVSVVPTAMRRLLDTLRTRFDRILIDMPPVAPLADVSIVSGMSDGLLMIVRAGVTPKPAIERALSGLDLSKVLGLVLNDAGQSSTAYRYDGYGYVAG